MDERSRVWNSTLRRPSKPMSKVSDRRDREWARAYGSETRVRWVQAQPCRVCGKTPSENAHVGNGGTGRKADADCICPLCAAHHRELHEVGRHVFEVTHGVDLTHAALVLEERWAKTVTEP